MSRNPEKVCFKTFLIPKLGSCELYMRITLGERKIFHIEKEPSVDYVEGNNRDVNFIYKLSYKELIISQHAE